MFADYNMAELKKEEEDEDSESSSYSYPSYSRFIFTGKTKSRLGRNRFNRPTNSTDELRAKENNSSNDWRCNAQTSGSSCQAPKTPSWLQRDTYPTYRSFTPSSHCVRQPKGSQTSNNDFGVDVSGNSNFLCSLKNDTNQSSTCKRNLEFDNEPFKSRDNFGNLRELSELFKTTTYPTFNFYPVTGEEDKENIKQERKNECTNKKEADPFNKLNQIYEAPVFTSDVKRSDAPAVSSFSETSGTTNTDSKNYLGRFQNEPYKSSLITPYSFSGGISEQKKDEDDISNTPLDLSSGDSLTVKNAFSKLLIGGREAVEEPAQGTSCNKADASEDKKKVTVQETASENNAVKPNKCSDISNFLPKFLMPMNKNKFKFPEASDDIPNKSPPGAENKTSDLGFVSNNSISQKNQFVVDNNDAVKNGDSSNLKQNVYLAESNTVNPELQHSKNNLPVQSNMDTNALQSNSLKKASPPLSLKDVPEISPPSKVTLPTTQPCTIDSQEYSKPKTQITTTQENKVVVGNDNPDSPIERTGKTETCINLNSIGKNNPQTQLEKNKEREIRSQVRDKSISPPSATLRQDSELSVTGASTSETIVEDKTVVSKSNEQSAISKCNKIEDVHKQYLTPSQSGIKPPMHLSRNQQIPFNNLKKNEDLLRDIPSSRMQQRLPVEKDIRSVDNDIKQIPSVNHAVTPVWKQVSGSRGPENINSQPRNIQQYPRLEQQRTYVAPQHPVEPRMGANNPSSFPGVKPDVPQQLGRPNYSAPKRPPTQYKGSGPRGPMSRANEELEVNNKSYTILSLLGKGGSSEVYQVLDPRSSKLMAVKCVDLSMVDKTIADGYLNEIDLLSKLQGCASVIRMFDYEYVQDFKMLYVVMEKGDTDLSQLIKDISKTKKISMSMIIYYWTEMLTAVRDIHEQGIIHSDLKPANFLLVSGRLKLIDFGIASSQGDMTSVVKEVTTGTWNYMSPEALRNTNNSAKGFKITYKSDVWSLGCILYNLVYGKTPFSHITNTWGKLQAIADPNHQIHFPEVGAPVVLLQALRSCFHRDPKQRPTVAELLALQYHATCDANHIGQQLLTILPNEWWLKVSHLFPDLKSNEDTKKTDNNAG